jgi:tRNA(Ile)-lysidine synthase
MDLAEQVTSFITRHNMLTEGERLLIALSGGPDSVCMATILNKLEHTFKLTLIAIYIDHGLRPEETPRERVFCGEFCRSLNIEFTSELIDVRQYRETHGLNLQEAARELRYQKLTESAKRFDCKRIALGHNLDDQAETFFMRMLRGAGPGGLSGIPPVRGNVIRPLMGISRADIEAYLKKENISFIVDSSNLKEVYMRNRVRSQLMPVVRELNPGILDTVEHTVEILRDEERYFQIQVTKALMKLITRKTDTVIELFLSPLMTMDRVILRRVLRRAIEETKGLRGIGFAHVEDIIRLIKDGDAGDRVHLPEDFRAIKKYATLLLTAEPPVTLDTCTLDPGVSLPLPEVELLITATVSEERPLEADDGDTKMAAVFDADKVTFPLTVRARKSGDFFYPRGFGKTKKLQDFFVDEKIPRDERDAVPVLVSGDDIIWVAGYRASEFARADEETKRFLLLKVGMLSRGT